MHPAYLEMCRLSGVLGLPRAFKSDLTKHDMAALAAMDPSTPFAWVLYDSGTHLCVAAKTLREHALVGELVHTLCGLGEAHVFIWDVDRQALVPGDAHDLVRVFYGEGSR